MLETTVLWAHLWVLQNKGNVQRRRLTRVVVGQYFAAHLAHSTGRLWRFRIPREGHIYTLWR
jgi:hypothetical protein